MMDKSKGSERGFAAMDEDKQRRIARKGGESVPAAKRSFSQDHDLAVEAGRKGGQSVAAHDRSFSRDRRLAAEAGRKGGLESSRSSAAGGSTGLATPDTSADSGRGAQPMNSRLDQPGRNPER